ncbi:MAG: T9SS type A sorting domain-containing protein [Saprospiraceae bacterium]|nr:T9SS type A sorting domain-containing protein [Saprospiraceae bacterium]
MEMIKKEVVCSVENFTITEVVECDGEMMWVRFSFQSNDFGLNGYTVRMNGSNAQTYTLSSNRVYQMTSECLETVHFEIFDNNNPNCSDTYEWEPECCECNFDFAVEQLACENGMFDAIFILEVASGSCLWYWDDAVLTINGTPYDFYYVSGNQYRVDNITSNQQENHYVFTFPLPNGEFRQVTRINNCFAECAIENFIVELDSTECSGEFALLRFDFESEHFGQNGYIITSNQGHEFEYNQNNNRVMEIIADCIDELVFTIRDVDDEECSATFEFGTVCCPCMGEYFMVEEGNCNNGSFNAWHRFEWISGSCFAHDYTLSINGQSYPFTWINSNTLRINNITFPDSLLTYEFCTTASTGECFTLVLPNPCFESQDDCSLVFEEIDDLVCDGDSIYMNIIIIGQNSNMQGFDVYLNDSFVTYLQFEQDSLYELVLHDPGDQTFVLTICNDFNQDCCSEREFENPCFEPGNDCSLVFEEIGNPECDGDNIYMSLIIIGQNISQTGFDVYLNDSFLVFLPFEQDSIYDLIIPDPGTQEFILTICDNDHPDCCNEREFENPCYDPENECNIVFEEIGNPECDGDNIYMSLIIIGQNICQTGFDVYLNDSFLVFLPYEQDSIYDLIIPDPGTQGFILTICDNDHPDCCNEREFENPCYDPEAECSVVFEEVGNPECDGDNVYMSLIIVGQNISQTGFDVFLNGSFLIYLPFDPDSMYNIVIADPGTPWFNLTICDNDNSDCCFTREYENPCHDPNIDCSIIFEETSDLICENDSVLLQLIIVGQNVSQTGFDVFVNGTFSVFLQYDPDSTYQFVIPDPVGSGFVLTICDNDHPNCCHEREFENPCYDPEAECSIVFEEITDLQCENGQIVTSLIIIGQNTSMTGYDVFVNDSMVLYLPFNPDSVYQISVSDPGTEEFIMTVCDHENSACCRARSFENPCALQGLCWLENLEAEAFISGQDSIELEISYDLGGSCTELQTCLIWVEQNSPAEIVVLDQNISHRFAKINVDTINIKLCFTEPFDTCIGVKVLNPFISSVGTEDIIPVHFYWTNGNIHIINQGLPIEDLMLYDNMGKMIFENDDVQDRSVFIPDLHSGMYHIMYKRSGKTHHGKLVVMRL